MARLLDRGGNELGPVTEAERLMVKRAFAAGGLEVVFSAGVLEGKRGSAGERVTRESEAPAGRITRGRSRSGSSNKVRGGGHHAPASRTPLTE